MCVYLATSRLPTLSTFFLVKEIKTSQPNYFTPAEDSVAPYVFVQHILHPGHNEELFSIILSIYCDYYFFHLTPLEFLIPSDNDCIFAFLSCLS